MNYEPERIYKENLKMYTHLIKIRDKLWIEDSKSRVSVMIGSGFSKNATKIEPSFEGMSLWDDLKRKLVEDLMHHENIENKDVLKIAQIYSDEYGRSSLDELLKSSIPDNNFEPDTLHFKLLNLPWTDIYTTNYDTLLERAKRSVYEKSYQVIYDVNDIPSSVQPRIVKLHGSFPANRPFIFTKSDYDNYPENFSPFVNMVQQSIMETTFVLIGFSGDDPNFIKWTSWVKSNLKEHMPKIYMIGYDQESRRDDLEEKGITLIDFKEIYKGYSQPFTTMFNDLFEFLSYKNKVEKMKWPHKNNIKVIEDTYDYNRNMYPGWAVLPDEIRRYNSEGFWRNSEGFITEIKVEEINKDILKKINEVIWYLDRLYINLSYDFFEKLRKIVEVYNGEKLDLKLILLRLIKEARLDFDQESFQRYLELVKPLELNDEENHALTYEKILFNLDLNKVNIVLTTLENWKIGSKELEWGIKKACIYTRVNEVEKAEPLFKDYLQTIRSLLAIKMDDYRLLSLESIILHHLRGSYGKDRLRNLSTKYCDSGKEFKSLLRSIKEYRPKYGTKTTPVFDPGRETVTTNFGSGFVAELAESYALVQIKEEFNFQVADKNQYELALKNIDSIYPQYSLAKRILKANKKEIENLFTREYVYSMDEKDKNVLINILENTLTKDRLSNIENANAIEILSRIYMIMDAEIQNNIDFKILSFIERIELDKLFEIQALKNAVRRIFYAKHPDKAKEFVEKLIELDIRSQKYDDKSVYISYFFEPVLEIFSQGAKVEGMKISPTQPERLLEIIKNNNDYSIKESAFLRLAFLSMSGSLDEHHRESFKQAMYNMETDKRSGISDFLIVDSFDNIANGKNEIQLEALDDFIVKDIPIFYKENSMSDGTSVFDYFQMTKMYFKSITESDDTNKPDKKYYQQWFDKFYPWWESQKPGFFQQKNRIFGSLVRTEEMLLQIIVVLKNNIWGAIPLGYLREEDKYKISAIFNDILNGKSEMAQLLIPSLIRIGVGRAYNLKYILENLSDKNEEKSKFSITSLYDYTIFISKNELDEDFNLIKNELFQILKYGHGESLNEAIHVFTKIVEMDSDLVDDSLISSIIDYLNKYLVALKEDETLIRTYHDFKLLGNYARLVAILIKYKSDYVGKHFDEWKNFILNHKLPEVRSAIMHFE
ncbi:SIR2 family protein [Planomicrobium sp. CPCC 101079]|uniref:SIR2 family NAD-dependent protein deacylase n=1 Tax=Planomicrobium sp. CPCC 101079 TaxID=2599618 RepID=UPI0011B6547E|nr:SIR2 family protein [Planomicrobium sp. CPCC 101079]TWT00149.1 SIR2 family protein [Planomicrobium sp. CPCC 101079]